MLAQNLLILNAIRQASLTNARPVQAATNWVGSIAAPITENVSDSNRMPRSSAPRRTHRAVRDWKPSGRGSQQPARCGGGADRCRRDSMGGHLVASGSRAELAGMTQWPEVIQMSDLELLSSEPNGSQSGAAAPTNGPDKSKAHRRLGPRLL